MTEKTFPAANRHQYPGLATVFDENAVHDESVFTTYLRGGADQRVLTTLVEELFRVLEYTVIPVESWPDTFDTVIRKRQSEYPIHTTCEGNPSRTALQQLTAAHTASTVPHSILISGAAPQSERTKRVAQHAGVRVIDHRELRELVQGAISRLSEPVHPSRTQTRHASANPEKIEQLIGKLEDACNDVDTLLDRQEFADAVDRRDTVQDALSKLRTRLPDESENHQFRERLTAVETRLTDITSTLETAYAERIAAGDSHVETAKTAVADGDVTTGVRACTDARTAYADAHAIAKHSEIGTRGATDDTVPNRVKSVTQLEEQLRVVEQVQQAETTIESLATAVTDTNATTHDPQHRSELHAAARAGFEELDALPDDISDPALQARVTALANQVERFKTAAQHSQSIDTETPSQDGTDTGSDETTTRIRTASDIVDRATQPAPVVLRLHEELTEDGRRTVFRAETLSGDPVQVDIWHRHVDKTDWVFDDWYEFEAVRGQRWTVNGKTGITVSTTPNATITQRDSIPGSDVITE